MKKVPIVRLEKDISQIQDITQIIFDTIFSIPLTKATTLFLEGQLGAGKTTLTQEIGRLLEITKPLTSPTYTIMNEYEVKHPQFKKLIHMDLYRIETLWELQEYQLEEDLLDPHTMFIIEWSKTSQEFFQNTHCFQVDILQLSQDTRTYTISKLETT